MLSKIALAVATLLALFVIVPATATAAPDPTSRTQQDGYTVTTTSSWFADRAKPVTEKVYTKADDLGIDEIGGRGHQRVLGRRHRVVRGAQHAGPRPARRPDGRGQQRDVRAQAPRLEQGRVRPNNS